MKKGRYCAGSYVIRDDLSYAGAVRDLIEGAGFRELRASGTHRLAEAGRRRASLYSFRFPPADRRMVMKVARLDPRERFWRRIDWYIRRLRKDYARGAFRGALLLEQAGIDTGKPVAYWSYSESWSNRESYFLYEHIDGGSIGAYTSDARDDATSYERLVARCMVKETIEIARRLHASGLRHGDIHSGNLLAEFDAKGCPHEQQAILSRLKIYLIDTDHVRKAQVRLPVINQFFDLRCLRGIDLHQYGRRRFLCDYLGKESKLCLWTVNFWSRGGFKLRDWWKPPRGMPGLASFALMADQFIHKANGALMLI